MSWFRIRFDGEGLAFAKITRYDPSGTVYLRPGRPRTSEAGTVYPTVARLEGFGRVRRQEVVALLETQYGPTQVSETGDTVRVDMPARRLWADALTNLRPFERLMGQPYITVAGGYVTVVVESISSLPDAQVEGFLHAAVGRGDVERLDGFDPSPWNGLEPERLETA